MVLCMEGELQLQELIIERMRREEEREMHVWYYQDFD